ncbi:hypothetical protein HDU91_006079 [Kappamyces sp. JEL0680]|nr:hypothetical protein HDU91_006079 [Kappamyces sp. JEL0680]
MIQEAASHKANPRAKRAAETSLWNAGEKLSYETTQKSSYFDKSKVLKYRSLAKETYEDKLWFLGFEDYDMLYRRKKYEHDSHLGSCRRCRSVLARTLTGLSTIANASPPLVSTHSRDFNAPEFSPTETPAELGRVAGLVTLSKGQGLTYGSERFNQITASHKVDNKRSVSIFCDEIHSSAIQKFRDDLPQKQLTRDEEQSLVRKPVDAGLTIPLAASYMREPSLCVYRFD